MRCRQFCCAVARPGRRLPAAPLPHGLRPRGGLLCVLLSVLLSVLLLHTLLLHTLLLLLLCC